jgi:hypothetical protein
VLPGTQGLLAPWPACQPVVGARAELFRAALDGYGASAQVLTDNHSQYVTWRAKSAFTRELEKRGVRQVVAAPSAYARQHRLLLRDAVARGVETAVGSTHAVR